jgi:kinesin family protein 6/9
MEIYNERIYDLLVDVSRPEQAGEFTIVEERDGRGIFVRGLTEIEVRDESSALNLLFTGGLSKTTATHKLNKRSNRSHSIFTLYLQQRQRSGVSEKIVHSKLHLIDLAGSERLKKTMDSIDGSMGDEVTRKESMAINRSLTYLEQCVVALTRKGQGHVPYRQSKLTNILKDCLGANCNTVMIACIWGESSHLEETISTLRLASRMMKVQNETVSVESVDPQILLKRQEKIIKALKQELLMHDALVERTGMVYDSYTPEQQSAVSQQIEKYVAAPEKEEDEILRIDTFRQMLEICKQFKKKLIEARQQSYSGGGMGSGAFAEGKNDIPQERYSSQGSRDAKTAKEVGQIGGANRGFALGEARADARPSTGVELPNNFYAASPKLSVSGYSNSSAQPASSEKLSLDQYNSVDKGSFELLGSGGNDLSSFEQFIKTQDDGREWLKQFNALKLQIKELKSKVRTMTSEVNDAKLEIDKLNVILENKKASRIQSAKRTASSFRDEIVDDEELTIAKSLKETKQRYRNNFEQMQKQQNLLNALIDELEDKKSSLVVVWKTWQQEQMESSRSPSKLRESTEFNMETDELDDQEAFDKLERERVMLNDPESLAFFTAQKTRRANLTQSGGTIRMMQKNKRNI